MDPGRLAAELLAPTDPTRAARVLAELGTAETLGKAFDQLDEGSPLRQQVARSLLFDHAAHPEATGRFAALDSAASPMPDRADRIELALAWLNGHDNARAIQVANALLRSAELSDPERCRLTYIRGKALRKMRRYRPSLRALARARARCAELPSDAPERELAMKAGLLETRVLGILGRAAVIEKRLDVLSALAPGHSYLDDVLTHAAEASRGQRASARFRRVAEMDGDQAPRALWRLAWDALEKGRTEPAVEWLQRVLESRHADLDDTRRAAFFLGRLEIATSTSAAADRWERLARRPDFYGFAALFALRELDRDRAHRILARLRASARDTADLPLTEAIRTNPSVRRARRWFHAGLPGWAVAELRELACRPAREHDPVTLAGLLYHAGALPEAQRLVRWANPDLLGDLTPSRAPIWRLAYPLAFEAEVAAAAKAEGLDPLLLTALAREESTFDPDIRSWAGASGLTQLMPPTAEAAFLAEFGGRLDPDRVLEPALNLRLGAHVLAEGLASFGDVPALALAAYNGGPGLARRLLPRHPVRFERWAEANPVKENRGYVKRVLGTWFTYRLLHAPGRPLPPWPRTLGPGATIASESVDNHSQD